MSPGRTTPSAARPRERSRKTVVIVTWRTSAAGASRRVVASTIPCLTPSSEPRSISTMPAFSEVTGASALGRRRAVSAARNVVGGDAASPAYAVNRIGATVIGAGRLGVAAIGGEDRAVVDSGGSGDGPTERDRYAMASTIIAASAATAIAARRKTRLGV